MFHENVFTVACQKKSHTAVLWIARARRVNANALYEEAGNKCGGNVCKFSKIMLKMRALY